MTLPTTCRLLASYLFIFVRSRDQIEDPGSAKGDADFTSAAELDPYPVRR